MANKAYGARVVHISPPRDEEPVDLPEISAPNNETAYAHYIGEVRERELSGTLQVYRVQTETGARA